MPPVRDYSRHSESSSIDDRPHPAGGGRLFQKIFDQIFKACIGARRKSTLEEHRKTQTLLPKQPKVAFCAAHIPGKNHRRRFISAQVTGSVRSRSRVLALAVNG